MYIRAGMKMDAVRSTEIYKIKVNGKIVNEVWNNFRSWHSALDYLSDNYGILVGINFLMDDISIYCVEEKEYQVVFS